MKLSELAGWLGVGFLVGVAAHSVYPYAAIDIAWLFGATVIGAGLALAGAYGRMAHPSFLIVGALILSVVFGVYRFELERPYLPRGLGF